MAGSVRSGSLERAVSALTLGTITRFDHTQNSRFRDALGEYEQQYQVPFGGLARQIIAWQEIEVKFDVPFVISAARNSNLKTPQFFYGASVLSGQPIIVSACVTSWDQVDNETRGAKIAVGSTTGSPSIPELRVNGVIFLTFQGYGAPYDEFGQPDIDGSVG